MRIRPLVLAFAALLILAGCGSPEKDGALSYSPARPGPGGVLSIEYHPDQSSSPLKDPAAVSLRFTLMGAQGELYSDALPMEASGGAWRVELEPSALMDSPALLVCAFLDGEDPERVDNRQGRPWRILFQEGGEPVLGARYQEYRLLSGRERLADVLTVPRDREAVPAALEEELRLHSENLSAQIRQWADLLSAPEDSDSLLRYVGSQLPSLIEAQRPVGGEDLAGLVDLYGQMDQVPRRDSLVAVISEELPESEAARVWALRRARSQADPAARIREMRRVLDRFAGYEDEAYDRGLTVYWALTRANQPELAREILDEGGALDPDIGEYCADLLRQQGDRGRALSLLRRMQAQREEDEWSPEGTASRQEWESESSGMLAQNLFLQAQILITEGLSRDALPLMDRILEEMPEHADGELLRTLIDTEIRMDRTEGVVGHFEKLLEHSDPTDEEMRTWREHYGDEAGFLAYLAELRDAQRQKAHESFERHALRWPAPEVIFTDEAGEGLSLAALEGKVVLLDFWATWCGPCRMALPGVNALAHEMEGEENLFVLPANTWERSRGDARRRNVAESWEALGMDIPVYFDAEDEDGPAPAVEQFGVTGIPTQFIIGKDGTILFKMVGFHGESGERELRQKIEWALAQE